ncbi:hypothetical protein [Paenibacillus arenosi]|uniref:Uncharacterized protein n=1 Tax=Paenibacillus arenosi TaxID=2774142 RepID=A0ABR9AYA3_9BACL|nr:hypothetical protein [Paenibacillus arenosi]MBD8498866.1 hypothetical protein [Paenibacillus arenosi]
MKGYMNKCPHCGSDSAFVPENMECDQALVLWCKSCGNFINQTFTLETIRRWWIRFDEGEEAIIPPINRSNLIKLQQLEQLLNEEAEWMEGIELHIKDFKEYEFSEVELPPVETNE